VSGTTLNSAQPLPLRASSPRDSVDTSQLLTVAEVAELLKVPVSWVYERTRRRTLDRIPGFRLGKYWRFRAKDILGWIESQRDGAGTRA
jgi:excisionase family DNA binding protein